VNVRELRRAARDGCSQFLKLGTTRNGIMPSTTLISAKTITGL
jgi:hypothetical protein